MSYIITKINKINNIELKENNCCGIKSKSYLTVSKKDHDFKISHRKSYTPQNIITKIFFLLIRPFWRYKQDVDALKDLKNLYKRVLNSENPLTDPQKKVIRKSFDTLKNIFNSYKNDKSIEAFILRNDILEAFAVALKKDGLNDKFHLNIERIKAIEEVEPFNKKEVKSYHKPYIRMEDIEKYTKLIKQKFPNKIPTLKEILQDEDLKKYIIIEKIKMAQIMETIYKSKSKITQKTNELFSRSLTKYFGRNCNKELKPGKKRTKELLKFFKKLNISLVTNIDGELYSYSEIFKNKFRDEISKDAAFQRKLNDNTKTLLMKKIKNNEVIKVISAAFCRLRFLIIKKGEVNKCFSIEGKKLGDNSKEDFSIQNMFGNENDVEIAFNSNEDILKPNEQNALYLYLRSLTNYVNNHDATLVVQRLSPEDVHHYVEPVGGTVLCFEDVCEILKTSKTTNQVEKDQLSKLIKYFKQLREEENISYTLVKIHGTHKSVNSVATQHQSPLSQNDRKIQVVQLKDGSIAIHIFIGAINVNNVAVTRESGDSDLGAEVGAMGFGDDKDKTSNGVKRQSQKNWHNFYHPKNHTSLLKSLISDDSLNNIISSFSENDDSKMTNQKHSKSITRGDAAGIFPKEGSTVVSMYFNFKKTDLLEEAAPYLKYIAADGQTERSLEIKTNMFDEIGEIVT
ncbi:MAG: hypothetical protein AMS24_00780 [Chlamydiae bacterium SM23_39]|nr:MAG: hypothetical protein AMS24_00780 [Chlamydiae bacterium SM23_39]